MPETTMKIFHVFLHLHAFGCSTDNVGTVGTLIVAESKHVLASTHGLALFPGTVQDVYHVDGVSKGFGGVRAVHATQEEQFEARNEGD